MNIKKWIYKFTPKVLLKYVEKIDNSPIGLRLARGTFWSLMGAVISRGLMLVASISVARILGKTGFGEFGMVQSTVGMFGVFAGFGLGLTAIKYVAEFRKSDPNRAGRIIGLSGLVAMITGSLMAIGLLVFAPWLAVHSINAPHLAGVLKIGSIILFLSALNGAQTGALAGFEAFKTIAYVNFWVGLVSFPLLICGAYFGGLDGAVWALAINLGLNWLFNHVALKTESKKYNIPLTFKGCGCEWPVLWKFSLPSVLGGAMVGPITWACNAMLVNQPNGYSEMGVYNAILRIKQVPEMILMMLMAPLLPMLSEYFGKGDINSYKRVLTYAFLLSLCIVVPISIIQTAVPSLTLLPYGEDFRGNSRMVQWMMLHAVILGVFYPFGNILSSMNRMWFGFIYNLFWGILYLVLSYVLVPRYDATGLAASFALTYLVTSVICLMYIQKKERSFIVGIPIVNWLVTMLTMFIVCVIISVIVKPTVAAVVGSVMATVCVVRIVGLKRIRLALFGNYVDTYRK